MRSSVGPTNIGKTSGNFQSFDRKSVSTNTPSILCFNGKMRKPVQRLFASQLPRQLITKH